MPLSSDGKKVLKEMIKKRGMKGGKGEFYASINKGVPGSDKWELRQKAAKKMLKKMRMMKG